MGGGSILVVDDDRLVRMAVRALLEHEGYRVAEAGDGSEALLRLDVDRPDAVLLDLMMPGMNGRELLHTLREVRDDQQLPVIVMTALRGAMASQFLAMGADDFIYKPFDEEILLNKLALAIVRRDEPDTLPQRPRGSTPQYQRKVVLCVERNPGSQRQLDQFLTERGFTMVSVSQTSELSRLARALEPRAIVVNLDDDTASTLATVRSLRDEPSLDPVPIVATTSDCVGVAALDAQATAEPLDQDALLAFIATPPRNAARC